MRTLLIKHIASGQAFFTGAALMILVVLVSIASAKRRRWTMPVFFVGLVLVAISGTPLPQHFYVNRWNDALDTAIDELTAEGFWQDHFMEQADRTDYRT